MKDMTGCLIKLGIYNIRRNSSAYFLAALENVDTIQTDVNQLTKNK